MPRKNNKSVVRFALFLTLSALMSCALGNTIHNTNKVYAQEFTSGIIRNSNPSNVAYTNWTLWPNETSWDPTTIEFGDIIDSGVKYKITAKETIKIYTLNNETQVYKGASSSTLPGTSVKYHVANVEHASGNAAGEGTLHLCVDHKVGQNGVCASCGFHVGAIFDYYYDEIHYYDKDKTPINVGDYIPAGTILNSDSTVYIDKKMVGCDIDYDDYYETYSTKSITRFVGIGTGVDDGVAILCSNHPTRGWGTCQTCGVSYNYGYTISFNAASGSGTMTSETAFSSPYTLPECGFTAPEGFVFNGWSLSENGPKIDSASITLTSDVELYALWAKHEHIEDSSTVEFDVALLKSGSLNSGKSGRYYLKEDTTLTENLYVQSNQTLCLNGHVLNLNGYKLICGGCAILDCDDETIHKFKKDASNHNLYVLDESAGTISIKGGVITNGRIITNVDDTITMKNVNFVGNYYDGSDSNSKAVIDSQYSDISFENCLFEGNVSKYASVLRIRQHHNAEIEGCTFKNNYSYCENSYGEEIIYSGTIVVDEYSILNMKNSSMYNNYAYIGSAINITAATANLNNVTIKDNTQNWRGSIAVNQDSMYIMGESKLYLSGKCIIKDNKNKDNALDNISLVRDTGMYGHANKSYLYLHEYLDNSNLTPSTISSDSDIYVNIFDYNSSTFNSGMIGQDDVSCSESATIPSCLHSDASAYGFYSLEKQNEEESYYVYKIGTVHTISFGLNSGSGTVTNIVSGENEIVTLPDGTGLTRSGYYFVGWNENEKATTGFYTYEMGSSDVELYAIWAEKTDISITETKQTKTYNGSAIAFELLGADKDLTGFSIKYKKSTEADGAYSSTAPTNAGNYKVKIERASDTTHNSYSKVLDLEIQQLAVNEPTVNGTYKYNGNEQIVSLTGVESYMSTESVLTQTNPGTYNLTFTLDSNHKWANGSDGIVSWTIIPGYTVTYDPNTTKEYTGTLPTDTNYYSKNENVTVSSGVLNSDCDVFIGWNTDPSATTGLTTFVMGDNNVTLYAIWHVHTYGPVEYKWNADNTKCTATKVCTGDASHIVTETVDVASQVVQQKDCTKDELTKYTATFTKSGFVTQTKENIKTDEKLGHNYSSQVTSPTCTAQGYTTHTCTRCEDTYKDTYVNALGHTSAAAVRENEADSTCKVAGSYDEVVYCSVCEAELSRTEKTIEVKPHTYGNWTTTLEPTCTEKGSEHRICSACSNEDVREIAAKGHTEEVDPAVAAKCTTSGKTEGKHCSVCNAVLVAQQETEPLGHNYSSQVTSPTCTAQGYTTHTCTRCSDTYKDTYVNALGHTSAAAVRENEVDSTCKIAGSYDEVVYCSVCEVELSRVQKQIAVKPHTYGNWTTTLEPTCTVKGSEHRICSACSNEDVREIAAKGHTEVIDPAVAAKCTTSGKTEGKHCSVCNAVLVAQQTVNALGHDLIHHDAKAATCENVGWFAYDTCSRCSYTTYKEIPVKQSQIVTPKDEGETKSEVKVETETGFDADVSVKVDVTVETETATEKVEAYNSYVETIKNALSSNEKVSAVYDVKLIKTINGQESPITAEDIAGIGEMKVSILLDKVDTTKLSKIIQIKADGSVAEIAFDPSMVEDGYYKVTMNQLSKFAFVYAEDVGISTAAVVGIVLGSIFVLAIALYFVGAYLYKKGQLKGKFFDAIYVWVKKEDCSNCIE